MESSSSNAGYFIIALVVIVAIAIGAAVLSSKSNFVGTANNLPMGPPPMMPGTEGFASAPVPSEAPGLMSPEMNDSETEESFAMKPNVRSRKIAPRREGFANPSEPSNVPFAAGNAPSNCYPKNQLNATELLPADPNSKWAQVNPQGAGDIAGKNYLNAGALIGVNTVGQSLRNASHDLRSEPANPQVAVSPWFNSTIEPDINRRVLEIQ
jgi:hypothetical protein